MTKTVAIIDDDPQIRDVLRIAFETHDLSVTESATGRAFLASLARGAPDIAVLDIGMPGMDGLETCRELRKTHDFPVIFLTARDDEIDRVLGFEFGGDDYVTKPFSTRELVLRVKAVLKRAQPTQGATAPLTHGDLQLDLTAYRARLGDNVLELTTTELDLLMLLARSPDRVLRRTALIDQLYGHGYHISDRTIDSHIRNIRAKAQALGCHDIIRTVHAVGFSLGHCRIGTDTHEN